MKNPFIAALFISTTALVTPNVALGQAVKAPFAQYLITSAMSAHPELQKMGIHVIPPGAQDDIIIACSVPSKIGKKSSIADLQVEHSGKPTVKTVTDKQFYDLALPLSDAQNHSVGMIVIEMRFTGARSPEDSLTKAWAIVKEMESKIPDLEALFDKAPTAASGQTNNN
jgi:hypothetical protein